MRGFRWDLDGFRKDQRRRDWTEKEETKKKGAGTFYTDLGHISGLRSKIEVVDLSMSYT
jgi:hypothetical protein